MAKARYKQLVDTFAADIRSGVMLPGTRLPTHRKLAAQEGIAIITATRIYSELEAMGLVSGETGRGTFVRDISLPLGLGIDQHVVAAGMVDLNFNNPSLPGQTELLREALRQLASAGDLESLLRYQPHAGRHHERIIAASYLESRGLKVKSDNVLIVNGAQHGLAVTAMALLKPGDVVATDALTYPGFKVLAEALHLELVPIPATNHGPNLDALEKLCSKRRVRAVYMMPTLHNPMGWVMKIGQRRRLVSIARQHELLIIEDAAYAFLAENPPFPLATLAPEITVYISGISKSIATGLRVGFVVAPDKWIAQIERAIRATTWNTPSVMTAIVCNWLENGTVIQLEIEKREDAKARQQLARSILNGIKYISHPSSYFLWLPLSEEVRAEKIVTELMKEMISVSTAEPFSTSRHIPHAIRLALGSVDLAALEAALKKVKQVLDAFTY